MAERDEGSTEQ